VAALQRLAGNASEHAPEQDRKQAAECRQRDIPLLFLAVTGSWLLLRRRTRIELVFIAVAILAIAMTASINIGIRHLLPIYLFLAMIAAYAAASLWPRGRLLVVACLAWAIVGSAAAHPDYLPWMNAFAGKHPERVLEDSNFDWGQDIWRLVRVLKKRHIDSIGYSVFTNVRPSSVHFTQGYILDPHKQSTGWIVVSEHNLQLAVARDPSAYAWLTRTHSFERIGKTLRLYEVPAR
jgi:hypothetical protein